MQEIRSPDVVANILTALRLLMLSVTNSPCCMSNPFPENGGSAWPAIYIKPDCPGLYLMVAVIHGTLERRVPPDAAEMLTFVVVVRTWVGTAGMTSFLPDARKTV